MTTKQLVHSRNSCVL